MSATSVGSGVGGAQYGATPKVSVSSSVTGVGVGVGGGGEVAGGFDSLHQELDPDTNALIQKLLSLLLRVCNVAELN